MEALTGAKTVIDFAMQSTRVLLEKEIGESQFQRKVRRMTEYLKKKSGTVDWRKLQQSRILDGGHKEYEYVIESMESAGLIRITREGKSIRDIQ